MGRGDSTGPHSQFIFLCVDLSFQKNPRTLNSNFVWDRPPWPMWVTLRKMFMRVRIEGEALQPLLWYCFFLVSPGTGDSLQGSIW